VTAGSRDEDDRRDLTTEFMFFALLRKGINEELPGWPEVVVVFDGQDGSAQRKESDADYKANRPADGEALEPIRALPAVKAALDLFGISWVERLLGRQRVGPPGRGEGKLGALPGAGV
jgi:DNA polymerase-1